MQSALRLLYCGWLSLGETGHADNVRSVIWLKAAGEATFITLALTWTLTALFNPGTIESNALKNYVGYNNPCVGWDFPPANFFGLLGAILVIVLAWRYAVLHRTQTCLEQVQGFKKSFILTADLLYALSATCMSLIFLVGPPDGRWAWHTAIFVQLIVFRFLAVLARFVKVPDPPLTCTVFIAIYGSLSVLLPFLYFVNILIYEIEGRTGVAPVIPAWITMTCDYAWFLCLPLTTYFMPETSSLRVELALVKPVSRTELSPAPDTIGGAEEKLAADVRRRSPAR
eukprot:TRINITY_DN11597_c0_g1_i1.p1 TRINITY_DN11597_c0_g1~~TRINITY_DN11597_c0_g1_i1.p1  ORF type:complete len:284 (+),score=27.39 TRINITY_DN11597_c0_g1_i1:70-921(+)